MDILETIRLRIQKNENPFYTKIRLIIIDSISAVISPVLGEIKTSPGHTLMINLARKMKSMAFSNDIAFLFSNHTVSGEDKIKPALGESWTYVPNNQIFLYNNLYTNMRYAILSKSSRSILGSQIYYKLEKEGLVSIPAVTQANQS